MTIGDAARKLVREKANFWRCRLGKAIMLYILAQSHFKQTIVVLQLQLALSLICLIGLCSQRVQKI
jgi:hypothetical protein